MVTLSNTVLKPTMSYYVLHLEKLRSTHTFIIFVEADQASNLTDTVTISYAGYRLGLSPLDVIKLGLAEKPASLYAVRPASEDVPMYVVGTREQVYSTYMSYEVPGFKLSFDIEEKVVVTDVKDFVNCLLDQQGKIKDRYEQSIKELEEKIMAAQRKIINLKAQKDNLARYRETIKGQVIEKARELSRTIRAANEEPSVSEEEDEEAEAEADDE